MNDSACKCTEKPEKPTANAETDRLTASLSSSVFDKISVAHPTSKNGTVARKTGPSPKRALIIPAMQEKNVIYEHI